MARALVADGGDGLQMWWVAANVLNKQSRTADKGWFPSLAVEWATNISTGGQKNSMLQMLHMLHAASE
jgi:hypothetical protein